MSTEDYEDEYAYQWMVDDGDDWPPDMYGHAVISSSRWRPMETVNLPEDDVT